MYPKYMTGLLAEEKIVAILKIQGAFSGVN